MDQRERSGLHRRAMLAGLLGVGAHLGRGAVLAEQVAPTPVVTGDCEEEPGIEMLFAWRQGQVVYPSIGDSMPQTDWEPAEHPGLLMPYLIPPGWTSIAGWCDSISRDGRPNWTDTPMPVPWLQLHRVISPDGNAAFEYVIGNIQGQPLHPLQVAEIAKASIVGENQEFREICLIDDSLNQLAPSWFTADRWERSVLITAGTALGLPDVFLPATTVTFQNIIAPRRDLEELMYDVFLRILFQFLGGGGSDETPTPTPLN